MASPSDEAAEASFDPLRDGPLRYCGYANECGEAFAAWLPAFGVPLSYAVAVAYVLVDTVDKALAAQRDATSQLSRSTSDSNAAADAPGAAQRSADAGLSQAGRSTGSNASESEAPAVNVGQITALLTSERAIDTLLWQLLASVAIPGFAIHQVVAAVHAVLLATLHFNAPGDVPAWLAPAIATTASAAGASTDQVHFNSCFWATASLRTSPAAAACKAKRAFVYGSSLVEPRLHHLRMQQTTNFVHGFSLCCRCVTCWSELFPLQQGWQPSPALCIPSTTQCMLRLTTR